MTRLFGVIVVGLTIAGLAGHRPATRAQWLQPLSFARLPGWETGASGNVRSVEVAGGKRMPAPLESTAWISRNVAYRDDATTDPPSMTLRHLPANAVIVWAAISDSVQDQEPYIQLTLSGAKRFDCCGAVHTPGLAYELTGAGEGHTYSTLVRIYFGSTPTRALQAEARRALAHLRLPAPPPPTGGVTVRLGETRTFTDAELKPRDPIRCTSQGDTLTVITPYNPGQGGEGAVSTPPGKRAFHLNVTVDPNGSYTVRCGYGGTHL